MKKHNCFTVYIAALIASLSCGNVYAIKENEDMEIVFSFEEFESGSIRLPYRQAVIAASGSPSRLVIYLHGGTSKGNDNVSQLNEPGVDSIACFVAGKSMNTVFVVPQCPSDESWGGKLADVLNKLISNRIARYTDIKDVYILGGSMGGTGTWTMISKYPKLFSAAMPVAGNPSKCDAVNVAQTPFFTVMGTDDRIMSMEAVNDFVSELDNIGARYVFETEAGWSHEDVCIKSYTSDRLNWVFSNSRQMEEAGVEDVAAEQQIVSETRYWTLSGVQLTNPSSNGLYVVRQVDSGNTVKIYKRYVK